MGGRILLPVIVRSYLIDVRHLVYGQLRKPRATSHADRGLKSRDRVCSITEPGYLFSN